MGQLKYLVIHTADTPYDRTVTPDDIIMWHQGAMKNKNGTYSFAGKKLTLQQLKSHKLQLPSGNSISADKTNGRGWTKPGYSDFIDRAGCIHNLVPYTFDDVLETWEITNGVANKNSIARHVCLAGGWSKDGKIKNGKKSDGSYFTIDELYTKEQIQTLIDYIKMQVEMHPNVIVTGHNKLSSKTCPNFVVKDFLTKYGINCKSL